MMRHDQTLHQSGIENCAFKEIFTRYYPTLCFFAYSLVNDRLVAEDIVEDVFIRLWTKEKDFNKYSNIKSLVYISVKNACLNHIKTQRRKRFKREQLSYLLQRESEDFVLNEITRSEVLREIYEALQKLPPDCRKVMELAFIEGWDYKRISAHLGIAVSTVKNHKSHGIHAMLSWALPHKGLRRFYGTGLPVLHTTAMIHTPLIPRIAYHTCQQPV